MVGPARRAAVLLRRLPLLSWAAAMLVVLLGLTTALGGFATAPDRGRPVEPGEEIVLQRWRVHIDQASLRDDSYQEADPRIRLALRLEFLGEQTECCVTDGLIEVRYAGRTADSPMTGSGSLRSMIGFDPLVTASYVWDFRLVPGDLPAELPDSVEVVVRDERRVRAAYTTRWALGHAAASVSLPCADLRRRR